MDTCFYCGQQYHPMPVWTKAGKRIHVCDANYELVETADGPDLKTTKTDCAQKARADGYVRRMDLTPRR